MFQFCFGLTGSGPGEFRDPYAISISPMGYLYVADTGNNRIQKFDLAGNFLSEVGGFGWDREQFDRPTDVCAELGLELFVADHQNGRIERYDKDLNYISSLQPESQWEERFRFQYPSSLVLIMTNEMFIADTENDRILKISPAGKPLLTFGGYGYGKGELNDPSYLTAAKDLLLAVEPDPSRVVIFDYFGNYVREVGGAGVLMHPGGLGVDGEGNLFIADTGHHRVVGFDRMGRVILTFGEQGSQIGAFRGPRDVAVFKGKLYVLDSGNSRVQVFKIVVISP